MTCRQAVWSWHVDEALDVEHSRKIWTTFTFAKGIFGAQLTCCQVICRFLQAMLWMSSNYARCGRLINSRKGTRTRDYWAPKHNFDPCRQCFGHPVAARYGDESCFCAREVGVLMNLSQKHMIVPCRRCYGPPVAPRDVELQKSDI